MRAGQQGMTTVLTTYWSEDWSDLQVEKIEESTGDGACSGVSGRTKEAGEGGLVVEVLQKGDSLAVAPKVVGPFRASLTNFRQAFGADEEVA